MIYELLMAAILSLATPYEITAYHPSGFRTASGAWPRVGHTIACPRSIPFGTVLDIEGVGRRMCQDRGGAITTGRLDLFMGSKWEALRWGRRVRQVRVVTHPDQPGSPNEPRKGVGAPPAGSSPQKQAGERDEW